MTMRTFEYRLYPNKEQSHLLMQCLIKSRTLYNEMLETVKGRRPERGTFPTKYDLTAQFKGRGEQVPATTVQMLADRLSKSLKRFLAAKALGIADVGFPRFKKPNRWHSLQLRQYGTSRDVWLDADNTHLHVPAKIGKSLKIKLHRPLEGRRRFTWYTVRMDSGMPSSCVRRSHTSSTIQVSASILPLGLKLASSPIWRKEGKSFDEPAVL